LKEKKDCATRTIYQGRIGSETRAVVDLFEKNMVSQGKQFGPAIVALMDKENRRIAGLADSEPTTLTVEQEDHDGNYNNNHNNKTETLSTDPAQRFLKLLAPHCIGKRQINDKQTLLCLEHKLIFDPPKFREIRLEALKVGAILVSSPACGFVVPSNLLLSE
jgi:hypothetical protein